MRINFEKNIVREFGWIARPMDYAPRSLPGHAYWPKNRRLKKEFRCECGKTLPANRSGGTPYLDHVKRCVEDRIEKLRQVEPIRFVDNAYVISGDTLEITAEQIAEILASPALNIRMVFV